MESIRVGIYGLGLIGGSIAAGVRERIPGSHVIGFGRDQARLEQAKRLGIIDSTGRNTPEDLENLDYFIIGTPTETVANVFGQYYSSFDEKTIIMDVSSIKRKVQDDVARINKKGLYFIGTHPMAGSEKSGMEFARPDLFEKKIVAVIGEECAEEQLIHVREFWKCLGAQIVIVSADFHDEIVAATSHAPHMIAAAVSRYLEKDGWSDVRFFGLYGKGLLDTTRIAQGPPEMWADIAMINGDNIERALVGFSREIDSLIHMIRNNKRAELIEYLKKAGEFRESL